MKSPTITVAIIGSLMGVAPMERKVTQSATGVRRSRTLRSGTATALATLLLLAAYGSASAAPWTYRGTLNDNGKPAQGQYDLRLTLLDGGHALTQPLTLHGVTVDDGNFAVEVDFGVDLSQAPPLQLRTEVQRAGESDDGFVALGEPTRFDAKAALGGICWDTLGNPGTNPALNFIGTTDNQPLVLRTRNVQSLRIEPSSALFNGTPITANVIAGSSVNEIAAGVRGATISGGGAPLGDSDPDLGDEAPNRITGNYGTVGGGYGNVAGASFASVGGGRSNTADDFGTTVSGGISNTASDEGSTVGGGTSNTANSFASTVSGGEANSASDFASTVGGGQSNMASYSYSTVSGGDSNTASGEASTVGGGLQNTASGAESTVSGGNLNCAGGAHSWAGGFRAKVRPGNDSGGPGEACTGISLNGDSGDEGAFVWADSQTVDFVSTGPNQFLIRAESGFGLGMAPYDANIEMTVRGRNTSGAGQNSDLALVPNNGSNNEGILLTAINGGGGANDVSLRIAHASPSQINERLLLSNTGLVTIRSNINGADTGVTMAANAGAWTSLSDRSLKTAIVPVDALDVLARLVEMPLSRWSYIAQGESVRHIGPMAQDFMAAFAVGESDTGISTVDADGVALAAIQGLNQKLEAENAALRARLDAIEARLQRGH